MGYQEYKSSELLQNTLKADGFSIQSGVADIPTAFVASYGSGKPVIAILAEFDALPGLSQDISIIRKPLSDMKAGHACGHHLFGTASVAAAIAVKEWMIKSGTKGTLKIFGTPAEEGGSGKVYMVREGLFDNVDAVLHWHGSDRNDASPSTSLANRSAKFRFYGYSSHASGSPERLKIETVNMPGKGRMQITGKLGDVMQESVKAAKSYVRSKSLDFMVIHLMHQVRRKEDVHLSMV